MKYKPNFTLHITNLEMAQELIKRNWHDLAVTLLGPVRNEFGRVKPTLYSSGVNHLRIVVDDIDFPMEGWIHPEPQHVEKLLAHTKNIKPNDNVLIHCRAGISRSTSASIITLVQHGATPKEAFDYVHSIRPQMFPNVLLLECADKVMGLKHALVNEMTRWETENPNSGRYVYQ
jgi:predicted protein tyrosine phosphatase